MCKDLRGHMKIITVLISFLFSTILYANTKPIVSNITIKQLGSGSKKIDHIYYDVYDADGDKMHISLKVSDDNEVSWNVLCNSATGDIGNNISSGKNKHIEWPVGQEHRNINTDFSFKIIAQEGYTGDYGSVIDIDGNVYKTVKIGNQEWMAENLKVTHYRNGDPIPNITKHDKWRTHLSRESLKYRHTGAYCVYHNISSNADIYGNLYNWYAVADSRGLAPNGWHIPTDNEIKEMEKYLGMNEQEANDTGYRGTTIGSKLAGGFELWHICSFRTADFNTSGLCFLPAGMRDAGGSFAEINEGCRFWSSSEGSNEFAWSRNIFWGADPKVARHRYHKCDGLSVRCVKD